MSNKKIKVHGFEGEWAIIVDLKITDQPLHLVENTQNGKLLITVILGGEHSRVAGPFTAGEAFQGAVDILSGRTPLGSVTTSMQSIAAGLLRLVADLNINQQTQIKNQTKH